MLCSVYVVFLEMKNIIKVIMTFLNDNVIMPRLGRK